MGTSILRGLCCGEQRLHLIALGLRHVSLLGRRIKVPWSDWLKQWTPETKVSTGLVPFRGLAP